jgi:hypothetical protein
MTIELTQEQIDSIVDGLAREEDSKLHEEDISKFITFDNCHLIARAIYLKDSTIARGLANELTYWLSSSATKQMEEIDD